MKLHVLMMASLMLLAGCATQEPVAITDRGCREEACLAELESLKQKTKSDLDACASEIELMRQKSRAELDTCRSEFETSRAKAKADLDVCGNEIEALRQKSKADLDACNMARLDAEKHLDEHDEVIQQLEQRLLDQHRQAELSRQAMLEHDDAVRQLEQRLQDQKKQNEEFSKALAGKESELSGCHSNLSALQISTRDDADALDALRGELQKRTSASEQAVARMKQLESSLRQRLQEEIDARNVEIEQLKDQLSVRVLDRILFHSGSAEILPRGRAVLDSVAAAIAGGDETLRIEGHTDTVPIGPVLKSKYFSNWELSTGRASSVARYFDDEHGISPARIEAVGFSKYRPVASNDTHEDRQRNRRVEIVLTPWKPLARECPE